MCIEAYRYQARPPGAGPRACAGNDLAPGPGRGGGQRRHARRVFGGRGAAGGWWREAGGGVCLGLFLEEL